MGRISQYPLDTDIQGNDKWIGTSVNNANSTKNFSVDTVAEYLNKSAAVDSQALRYTYQNVQGDDVRLASTISFIPSLGDNVPFSSITEWVISAFAKQIKDVRTYYEAPLVGKTILITNAFNPSNWAIFRWDSVVEDIDDPNFYHIGLTHIQSTGELVVGQDYLLALLDASSGGGSAIWGDITGTLSSQTDLQNALNAKVPYTGAVANVDLGEFELKAGQIEFDQTPTGTNGVGVMRWNDTDGTVDLLLKGGNVTLQVGQEQVTRVVNKSGADFLEENYQAVRINGAQGNRIRVALALADSDANSAETLGLVTETIANNQEGFVTSSGLIRNINTTGSLQSETWVDGDTLYLSGTVLGAITNIKPTAPIHTVIIGYVVRAHATQGQIYVKVDNGYELGELHNVSVNAAVDKDILQYDGVTNLWTSISLSGAGIQPTLDSGVNIKTINGTSLLGSGDIAIVSGLNLLGGALMTSTLTAIVDSEDTASVLKVSTIDVTNNGGSGIATNTAFGKSALIANTTGAFNTSIGYESLKTNTTGVNNIAIGYQTLNLNLVGGNNIGIGYRALLNNTASNNIAIGTSALLSNTTGASNTIVGYGSGQSMSTGSNNVALGTQCLVQSTASNNTAIGTLVMNINSTGTLNVGVGLRSNYNNTTGSQNTGVGADSLNANNSGANNTALGYSSLTANTASNNTAVGSLSLSSNTTGTSNTAVGFESLRNNTTGINGTAIGNLALRQNTIGSGNTAIGTSALTANTTGSNNVAIGYETLKTSITNQNNTAIGYTALTLATSNDNTAVGYRSAVSLTTGSQNTFVGMQSGRDTLTGGANVSMGYNALLGNSGGSGNVAIGHSTCWVGTSANNTTFIGANAGFNNNASNNVGIGNSALYSNTTGGFNTGVGYQALNANTTGSNNTALGYRALASVVTGIQNTAIGVNALSLNTANSNTALGYNSLLFNTTGFSNTAIGHSSMQYNSTGSNCISIGYETLWNSNASNNIAIGNESLRATTSGGSNTAVGHTALRNTTTGTLNTSIGSGSLGDNITGGSNSSIGWNTASGNFSGSVILGREAAATASNQFVVGSAGTNAGSVVAEVNASANVWNVVINGVARKILLA